MPDFTRLPPPTNPSMHPTLAFGHLVLLKNVTAGEQIVRLLKAETAVAEEKKRGKRRGENIIRHIPENPMEATW